MSIFRYIPFLGYRRKALTRRSLLARAWFNTFYSLFLGTSAVFWITHRDRITPPPTTMMVFAPVIVTAAFVLVTAWSWFTLSRFRGN